MRQINVLHCPFNQAGNPSGLAKAERQLGIHSISVSFNHNSMDPKADETLWKKNENFLIREVKRWNLLWRAILNFDIIHFNFGHTILPDWSEAPYFNNQFLENLLHSYINFFSLKDLVLLKKLGKGICITYLGTDARNVDYCKKNFKITHVKEMPDGYYSEVYEKFKIWKIRKFNLLADKIYAVCPDLLHMLPKKTKLLVYASTDLNHWIPLKPYVSKKKFLVIHAPSNPLVKGTKYVLETVERLKSENIDFDFQLIENTPKTKVKKMYEKADLLIDQLLLGWYGVVAVELMALGKPVICYIRKEDLKFVPKKMADELPIINANPFTLYRVLKMYLTKRKNELPEIGRKGRLYVEHWHDPIKIAQGLKEDYEDILRKKSI